LKLAFKRHVVYRIRGRQKTGRVCSAGPAMVSLPTLTFSVVFFEVFTLSVLLVGGRRCSEPVCRTTIARDTTPVCPLVGPSAGGIVVGQSDDGGVDSGSTVPAW